MTPTLGRFLRSIVDGRNPYFDFSIICGSKLYAPVSTRNLSTVFNDKKVKEKDQKQIQKNWKNKKEQLL